MIDACTSGEQSRSESVLWEGHPFGGLLFRPADQRIVPLALVWTLFFIYYFVALTDYGIGQMVFAFAAVFGGIYIAVGRFFVDAYIRRSQTYRLTTQRVVIDSLLGKTFSHCVNRDDLLAIEIDEQTDGSATIRFVESVGWFTLIRKTDLHPTLDPIPQFIRVPNGRSVYDLARKQNVT